MGEEGDLVLEISISMSISLSISGVGEEGDQGEEASTAAIETDRVRLHQGQNQEQRLFNHVETCNTPQQCSTSSWVQSRPSLC